jgi:hypothetical protein
MNDFDDSRNSLMNALYKGDFERAKTKISGNLRSIQDNIKELQEYLFKIGSKKENKTLMEKA